ncbi:MAG: hypothetical protein QXI60_09675 [Thermofilaceae archaeon]
MYGNTHGIEWAGEFRRVNTSSDARYLRGRKRHNLIPLIVSEEDVEVVEIVGPSEKGPVTSSGSHDYCFYAAVHGYPTASDGKKGYVNT